MKGLIRNNIYTVAGSLKLTIIMSLLTTLAISIGVFFDYIDYSIIHIVVLAQITGASGLTGTAFQQDIKYKWSKFELTLPVTKKDIIRARYISFLFYLLIGVATAILTTFIGWRLTPDIDFERIGFSFSFGIVFGLLLPSFIYPLNLLFGEDKADTTFFISILLSMGLFLGSSLLIGPFVQNVESIDFYFRAVWIVISIAIYMFSYMFSVWFYNSKEIHA